MRPNHDFAVLDVVWQHSRYFADFENGEHYHYGANGVKYKIDGELHHGK
jgi:hypothetical protein